MARISIRTPGRDERIETLRSGALVLGRGRDCDICIRDDSLSRQHCRLVAAEGSYRIEDLGSRNGTRLNGARIGPPQPLMTGDLITLGRTRLLYVADSQEDRADDGVEAGQTISLDALSIDPDVAEPVEKPSRFALVYLKGGNRRVLRLGVESVTIGRHRSCSLVFNDGSVSSCHARIELRDGRYMIFDLGSTNGVKVNGRKVEKALLRPGSRIRIGKITVGFREVVSRQAAQATMPAEGAPMPDAPVAAAATPGSIGISASSDVGDSPEKSASPVTPDPAEDAPQPQTEEAEEYRLEPGPSLDCDDPDASRGDLGSAKDQIKDAFASFDAGAGEDAPTPASGLDAMEEDDSFAWPDPTAAPRAEAEPEALTETPRRDWTLTLALAILFALMLLGGALMLWLRMQRTDQPTDESVTPAPAALPVPVESGPAVEGWDPPTPDSVTEPTSDDAPPGAGDAPAGNQPE